MPEQGDFEQRMRHVEKLVHEIDSGTDPALRAKSIELVSLLMELHAAGLKRMLELLSDGTAVGTPAAQRFAGDPLTASLLLLHGLHPIELPVRVQQALEKVRPLLKSHGGNVELLSIDEGIVRLRLQGSCHGCPSSAQTLKNAIEEAVYEFAPDIADLQVDGVTATEPQQPAGFVPLTQLV